MQVLTLDISKENDLNSLVIGRIGDGKILKVRVNVTDNGVAFDFSGSTLTFEGVTHDYKSKIFDSKGIKVIDSKKGIFEYSFPNPAFGVVGRYETAYFSFTYNKTKRATTSNFELVVLNNADITAEEAKTIITEYDKLVEELQEKTDQYISDSDNKFTELNKKIADLQTKIDDYTSSVQTTANEAIQAVNDALAKLKAADFYTKEEVDSKLTDLSNKVIANKGNLASGTDLDNVINIGTYRIGGLTGGTDIINVPSERSGTTIYAYLTVSGTTTSVVQELIVYDSKTVSQIYSRSRSGSTPTFSPWSKTVVADDSGKVTVKDLEVTGTITSGTKNVLANGAYWMRAGQVITPSKSISDCANGWILHFTSYTSGMTGATKNGNNHFFYIPKEQVNIADVGTMFPLVVTDGTMTLKYLYLQNNKITGTSANESTNSKKYVLQNVLEY